MTWISKMLNKTLLPINQYISKKKKRFRVSGIKTEGLGARSPIRPKAASPKAEGRGSYTTTNMSA